MAVPKLIVLTEQYRGQSYELTNDMYTIGRSEQEDICIPDTTVSGRHAELHRVEEDGSYIARDLGSTNGTRINGVRITEQQLINSDILQVGGVEIMYDCEDSTVTNMTVTQTGIDINETAGGMEIQHAQKLNPYAQADRGDSPMAKYVIFGVIGLLAVVIMILAFILIRNIIGS